MAPFPSSIRVQTTVNVRSVNFLWLPGRRSKRGGDGTDRPRCVRVVVHVRPVHVARAAEGLRACLLVPGMDTWSYPTRWQIQAPPRGVRGWGGPDTAPAAALTQISFILRIKIKLYAKSRKQQCVQRTPKKKRDSVSTRLKQNNYDANDHGTYLSIWTESARIVFRWVVMMNSVVN